MTDYISREAFVEQKRKQHCEDCDRRKGMKNGKYKTLYEIGEAPCRACGIDDMLNDVEDFPAADVRPVVRGEWRWTKDTNWSGGGKTTCSCCGFGYADGAYHEVDEFSYCPNCGADMREPPKEET